MYRVICGWWRVQVALHSFTVSRIAHRWFGVHVAMHSLTVRGNIRGFSLLSVGSDMIGPTAIGTKEAWTILPLCVSLGVGGCGVVRDKRHFVVVFVVCARFTKFVAWYDKMSTWRWYHEQKLGPR